MHNEVCLLAAILDHAMKVLTVHVRGETIACPEAILALLACCLPLLASHVCCLLAILVVVFGLMSIDMQAKGNLEALFACVRDKSSYI